MLETAFAKINLALHVRAREPDGYHRIETIFAFAEDGDRLGVAPGDELSLRLAGPFARELGGAGTNLVLRAAQALRSAYDIGAGAALHLDKRLPVAAGLGGGSADAAAALRLLSRWWGLPATPDDLESIGRGLGADVAACVRSLLLRGDGRGNRLRPLADPVLDAAPLLLVNPGVPLSTAAVFAAWNGEDAGPLPAGMPLAAAVAGRNDLQAAACRLVPEIGQVMEALSACSGALLARMSGSGASCFALFAEEAARDEARARIAAFHPHWWQLATRLRSMDRPHA